MEIVIEYFSQDFTTHEIDGGGVLLDLKIKSSFLLGFVRSSVLKKSKYEVSHLLREMTKFELPDSGHIWLTKKENVVQKLGITFIYENCSLDKNQTILENLLDDFHYMKTSLKKKQFLHLVKLVKLEKFLYKYPEELSFQEL